MAKAKLVNRLITKKIHGDLMPRRRPSLIVQSGSRTTLAMM
jgi:hypothetical protein